MNKNELLKLREEKLQEIEEIDKELSYIRDKEFKEVSNYMDKFYNLGNSNVYFHVNGYDPDAETLLGSYIFFTPQSMEICDKPIADKNECEYIEVSKEEMEKKIREQMEYLAKKFIQ